MDEVDSTYRTYKEAREFVRNLKIRSEVEWYEYVNNAHKRFYKVPKDIPPNPDIIYRNAGWIDYSDWLGIEYLDFNTAKNLIRYFKIDSKNEWDDSYFTFMPVDLQIPFKPDEYYKNKGWQSWEDWLGLLTDVNEKCELDQIEKSLDPVAKSSYLVEESFGPVEEYLEFDEARNYIKNIGLENILEWEQYIAGLLINKGIKPTNIPAHPDVIYENEGWRGWMHWLGHNLVGFDEARKFVRGLNFKSVEEWFNYCLGDNKSNLPWQGDIPDHPELYYKGHGWRGWKDWLGISFMSYDEAKKFVQEVGLSNREEYFDFVSGKILDCYPLPINLPHKPDVLYKKKGWKDWEEFLGLQNRIELYNDYDGIRSIFHKKASGNYRVFSEARKFVHSLNLKNEDQWYKYAAGILNNKGQRPIDIPDFPSVAYKNTGWIDFNDWLGVRNDIKHNIEKDTLD